MRSNRANSNYGNSSSIQVDTASVAKRAFVKPNDLADITPGAQVLSAYLVLYQYDAGDAVEVKPVAESWNENTVTFNNQPAAGSTLTTVSGGSNGSVWIDITSLAQSWVDGAALHGVQLFPTSSDGVDYRSSEYGATSQQPRFEIMVLE